MESLPRDEDYEIWVLLAQTRHLLSRVRQQELRKYKLSPRQSFVLFITPFLGKNATQAEISRWLVREPNTTSVVLERMERQGLINRVKDLDRKNMIRVELTEKGHKAREQSSRRESIHKIMEVLSQEERQQLKSCLRKLEDNLLKDLRIDHDTLYPPRE